MNVYNYNYIYDSIAIKELECTMYNIIYSYQNKSVPDGFTVNFL